MELRPFQKKALDLIQNPVHLICIAPTGAGKSLIYEEIARRFRKKILLITPLVALARQQKENLENRGIKTVLNSTPENDSKTKAWIISPEVLNHTPSRKSIIEWKPDVLIVDECHCLADWGESFRPAFAEIPKLLHEAKIQKSLWLTATLPPYARKYLKEKLPSTLEIGEFDLPSQLSLSFMKVPWIERTTALIRWTKSQSEAGIIFVQTRGDTHRIASLLNAYGKNAIAYHAGLSREERLHSETSIKEQEPEIIVATSAFGMGMHHPYLRWSLLWQAPPSILSLAQSLGRAARQIPDQPNSRGSALVFWDTEDFRLLEWTAKNSPQRRQDLSDCLRLLSGSDCRKLALKRYFGSSIPYSRCQHCDVCRSLSA